MSARKGGNFEREICKKLSSWWTYGTRDDVFWRSSQSGGRATIRGRQGKTTAGSYGDIVALDSIGEPLTSIFTIELKRGRKHGEPGNFIDCSGERDCHPFLKALQQAEAARDLAGTPAWLLISKRDFHRPAVFFPSWTVSAEAGGPLFDFRPKLLRAPIFRYWIKGFDFLGVSLEKFLKCVDPATLAAEQ